MGVPSSQGGVRTGMAGRPAPGHEPAASPGVPERGGGASAANVHRRQQQQQQVRPHRGDGEVPYGHFQFAKPPPGAHPVRPEREYEPRPPMRTLGRHRRLPMLGQVLMDAWEGDYGRSPTYQGVWNATQDPDSEWPKGYKIWNKKLYHGALLCVPENRIGQVLKEHHEWNGHLAGSRLALDLSLRFEFPPEYSWQLKAELERVKTLCLVCQASQAPT